MSASEPVTREGEAARAAPATGKSSSGDDYIRSFNRFEVKYLISVEQARKFADTLEGYAHPDPHSGEDGYPVYSLYWDSPGLIFFWEKIDGEKYRRKLRFRRYQGSDDAFVEIKQRIDRTVQKRRVLWPVERIRALFDDGAIDPELEAQVTDRVGMEALFLCRYHDLEPKVAVAYRRHAYFGTYENDLRITFDTHLQYDSRALDLREPFESGKWLLPPDRCVMEIKFNNRVPTWLTALIKRHGLEIVRVSKYCTAIDREFFAGRYS